MAVNNIFHLIYIIFLNFVIFYYCLFNLFLAPISNVRHEHGKQILFELNNVPSEETHMVTSAEVHLYQSGFSNNGKMYSVTLYQVLIKKSG